MTARLTIKPDLFNVLLAGLAERGQGHRESGAFLLTDRAHPDNELPQPVTAIAFYDDLDPNCLTGRIDFQAAGYTALQNLCRRNGLRVAGDIHTHPTHRVQQSRIDAAHPMVARDGHVALIAPHFATGITDVSQLGVHVRVNGDWASYYGKQAAELLLVSERRLAAVRTPWWCRMLSRFRFRQQRQETR